MSRFINIKPIYQRILLKISGEVLKGNNKFGIEKISLLRIVSEIKMLLNLNIQVGVVVGGGNLFRGIELINKGISNITSDHIGMLSTVINGLAISDIMRKKKIDHCLMSAIPINSICETYNKEKAIELLSKKYVVIFSCGIGNPCFTTDTTACLRGIEINANIILKGTKVNGIYSNDPQKNPNAKLYDKITYENVLKKELKIMDLTAFLLARNYKLPILVFNINIPGILYRIVLGEHVGTLIYS